MGNSACQRGPVVVAVMLSRCQRGLGVMVSLLSAYHVGLLVTARDELITTPCPHARKPWGAILAAEEQLQAWGHARPVFNAKKSLISNGIQKHMFGPR